MTIPSKTIATALLSLGTLMMARAEPTDIATRSSLQAQANPAPVDAGSQANNPIANMTALSFQNYYIGDLTNLDTDADQFWMRFAKPFHLGDTNWIFRGSLPFNHFPTGPSSHEFGLGDLSLMAVYSFDTGNPKVSFGVGPVLGVPTATDSALGSEKWTAGISNVYFNSTSSLIQMGYLATWQADFAGDNSRQHVNVGTFQPFVFLQLGKGYYLRSSAVINYNFENDSYSVPAGLGIGKIIKADGLVYNFYIEPQFSLWDHGTGQPQWQIFAGLNFQFF